MAETINFCLDYSTLTSSSSYEENEKRTLTYTYLKLHNTCNKNIDNKLTS